MKKLIILALFLAILTPSISHAQTAPTNEELLAMINSLMVQVQNLLAKLTALEAQQTTLQTLGSVSQPSQIPSTVTVSPKVTVTKVGSGDNTELDAQARDFIADVGWDKLHDMCLGRFPSEREGVARERAGNPILDRSCVLSGY